MGVDPMGADVHGDGGAADDAGWAARARELLAHGDARLLKRSGRDVDIDRLLARTGTASE